MPGTARAPVEVREGLGVFVFALIVAVISLSSIDPDPIVSPAPGIAQRLPGGSAATGFAGGLPVLARPETSSLSVCTFGSRAFTSDYWANANAFTRALALPACTDTGASGFVRDDVSTGFVPSGFAPLGFAPLAPLPLGFSSPWLPQSASSAPGTSFHASALPGRIYVSPGVTYRGANVAPFTERMRPVPVVAPPSQPLRRH